jgi:hypothetical protein
MCVCRPIAFKARTRSRFEVPESRIKSFIMVISMTQLMATNRNLRYSRGNVDGIAFDPEETPPEDLL